MFLNFHICMYVVVTKMKISVNTHAYHPPKYHGPCKKGIERLFPCKPRVRCIFWENGKAICGIDAKRCSDSPELHWHLHVRRTHISDLGHQSEREPLVLFFANVWRGRLASVPLNPFLGGFEKSLIIWGMGLTPILYKFQFSRFTWQRSLRQEESNISRNDVFRHVQTMVIMAATPGPPKIPKEPRDKLVKTQSCVGKRQ